MTAPAIALEDVVLERNGARVLDHVTLEVGAGHVLALLGPSGAGKTSVLRVVLGFAAPAAGVVRLDGEPVSKDGRVLRPPEERRISVVFQDLALWPHLSVWGNLAFGLEAQGVPRTERERRIRSLLDRVGLQGKEKRYPAELSGGERQRVAIARALVVEPRAVLLDEPLANLDVALRREMLGLFREILSERGATALFVTHDLREASAVADRLVVIEHGRVVQAGRVDELRAAPATDFVRALVEDWGEDRPGPTRGGSTEPHRTE
jgi:iron(III) transport system ATP-binding protein